MDLVTENANAVIKDMTGKIMIVGKISAVVPNQ